MDTPSAARLWRCLWFLLLALPALAAASEPAAPLYGFAAIDSDGRRVDFAALRGKPLVVNFWARWCAPCRKEIPDLVATDAKYRGQGLTIIGLALEDNQVRDKVREFAQGYGVSYRIALAGVGPGVELMSALGNDKSALPFTVVIDRNGKITSRKLGAMSKDEMESAVTAVLK